MGRSNYKFLYNVDMVFCIDVTGTMDNIIKIVQDKAMKLHKDVFGAMQKKGKNINSFRIRIIAFRDYLADKEEAMFVSDFFTLPEENEKLQKVVDTLIAKGGGDIPEDGLEALAYAIRSNWNSVKRPNAKVSIKNRHIIVVYSDAPTHEIGFGRVVECYPRGMPKDFRELTEWWGFGQDSKYMNQYAKRLILFTPNESYWSEIATNWDNVVHIELISGKGLKDCNYEYILDGICNTI